MRITIGRAQRGLNSPLPGQAYVGRPSALGNPFVISRDGNRTEVIAKYRRWLWERLQTPGSAQEHELLRLLERAQGGDLELLCWCHPLPCHAEVVREALLLLNQPIAWDVVQVDRGGAAWRGCRGNQCATAASQLEVERRLLSLVQL